METKKVRKWWLMPLFGLLCVACSVLILIHPGSSLEFITVFFAVSFLVNGVLELVFAISNRQVNNWGWFMMAALLDILLGVLLLNSDMFEQMEMLAFFMAFWLMYKGISAVGYSFEMDRFNVRGWGWTLCLGILSTLLSIAMLAVPALALETLLILLGIAFLALGGFYFAIGFSLSNWKYEQTREIPV